MTFLPVVERELRVLARSRRLYWGRFVSAQLAFILVAWFWFTLAGGASANTSREIFGTLSILTFGYSLIAGAFLTADSVSEEKREGTLGLLFLTNLKGYDVAFGKLASNSLQAVYNLLAIFPVLTVPLLLGGVTGTEIFRMTLALLDTLLFSLTVGLLVSTWSKHDRKAQVGAFALLMVVTGGIPAAIAFLNRQYQINFLDSFYVASPGYTIRYAFDQVYKTSPDSFWLSLGLVHAFSWVALFLAAFFVRRVWKDQPAMTKIPWLVKLQRWKWGSEPVRRRYRESLLKVNPYYWLVARDRLKAYHVLWFLGGCFLFWLVLWSYNPRDMLEQEAFFATALLLHAALKVWLASEAGRQFFDDRKSSALELTLSTPMPVRDILEGQFLGLVRQFGPAFGVVLVFDVVGMIASARMRLGADTDWLLTWVATIIIFLVDAATIATLGMWIGLTAKRFSRGIAKILLLVLILPWIIFFAAVAYMAVARLGALNSLNFVIGAYFVISLGIDLVLFLNASANLTNRFREVATQRFDS